MDSSTNKNLKGMINEALQSSENIKINTDDSDQPFSPHDIQCGKSLQQIKNIFEKTEAMREVAKEKNHQLQEQFKDLKERLSSSSEYLLRIKKNIENLKFSYQKNVIEIQKNLDPATEVENIKSKEDMAKHMNEIRNKIDDLQNKMTEQRNKQQYVTESYQEAFDKVIDTLQEIETGAYSSQMLSIVQD
ncbi:unnamed protein product [Phaedon cochleariae]|uniref:Uncharacterized protein n=1 Tax=Phaedon cochleariae TaxID=80249 RepID=A0A9N9SI88_PHACE|nr:unnamed protein product [Phaedon cochleariae]